MAEPVIVSLAPGEDVARPGEADRELGPTLYLHRPQPRQALHLHGHLAPVAAAAPELAVVPVAPAPDVVVVGDGEGLGVPGAARHVDHSVTQQRLHQPRLHLVITVSVTESPVPPLAP